VRKPSDNQIEAAVALQNLGYGLPAESSLCHRPNVADVDSIARAGGSVGLD